ncbi:MAG: hypothetical protein QXU18_00065 [Thermoplasmatales archaeon]
MLDEKENVLLHARFENTRKGFESILQKFKKVEKSNMDHVYGVLKNPTGNSRENWRNTRRGIPEQWV